MLKKKIIIVGGGFGGVYTAKYLYKIFRNKAEITLISKSSYFIFTPLLHEVATGELTPETIKESLREIFRHTTINILEDIVVEVDKSNRQVKTSSTILQYDYLVLATGADTNYFNILGAKEHSFPLKNVADAVNLRNHIITTIDKADKEKNKDLLNFTIVGAGATGVELVTELVEYLRHILGSYYINSGFNESDIKINLITSTADIIPQFPEDMRAIALSRIKSGGINVLINTTINKVGEGVLYFNNGESLKTNTIIWVAGVRPNVSNITGINIVNNKGRIDINEYLQNPENPEIFALGDSAGTYPMLGQIAAQEAKTVAKNIYLSVNNKSLIKYNNKIKGLLISLGQWYAAGRFGKITLHGFLMWWIWRTVYLFNFHSWKKRFEIATEWSVNLFYPRDITYLE